MASGSLKDTVKALNATLSQPSVTVPLPEELQQILEAFLSKYQDIDDHDSQRLQDELLALFHKHVAPEKEKLCGFVHILLQLRPAIVGQGRLFEWWDLVIEPIVNGAGHQRKTVDEANDFIRSVLVFDAEEDEAGDMARLSKALSERIIETYFTRCDQANSGQTQTSFESRYISHRLEMILVSYGRRKPKEFLSSIDQFLTADEHGIQALHLLGIFISHQPPHLHLVDQTSLIDQLLRRLLTDASLTVVSIALTCLMAFLPHIPSTVALHLPKLFVIYSRLLCWDKNADQGPVLEEEATEEPSITSEEPKVSEKMSYPVPPDSTSSLELGSIPAGPNLLTFFTLLYGMYPLNLSAYIRKPRKYLKNSNYPEVEKLGIDQVAIRHRSEIFFQFHLVHPNFFRTTAEEELAENRWLKIEAAEVFTECMQLLRANFVQVDNGDAPANQMMPLSQYGTQSANSMHIENPSVVSNQFTSHAEVHRTTDLGKRQSDSSIGVALNSLQMPPAPVNVTGQSPLRHPGSLKMERRSLSAPGALEPTGDPAVLPQAATESLPNALPVVDAATQKVINQGLQPQLYPTAQSEPHDSAPPVVTERVPQSQDVTLPFELLLLRNELNFERYLKQQHLDYIGQLHRKHIREVAVEAETQSLLNTNRALRAKLTRAGDTYAQLKKEMVTSRNQFKKWEVELTSKLRSLKDDQKRWSKEEETLRLELARARSDCEQTKRLLGEREAQRRSLQEQILQFESDMANLDEMRLELRQLRDKVRQLEDRETYNERLTEESESVRAQLEAAKIEIRSRDLELRKLKPVYDRKISEIQSAGGQRRTSGLSPSVQQMIDSTLNATNSKNLQLKKAYNRLLTKYNALEMRMQVYEAEREAALARTVDRQDADDFDQIEGISTMPHRQIPFERTIRDQGPRSGSQPFPETSEEAVPVDLIEGFQSPSSGKLSVLSRTPPARSLRPRASYEPLPRADAADQQVVDQLEHPSPPSSYLHHESSGNVASSSARQEEEKSFGRIAIAKKSKDRSEKKEKSTKPGGLRGLRGLM